jgi:hypothetical protein
MMGGGGGFLWFLIVAALVIVPFWRLLPRFGIPSWVALAAIIPFGAIVLLWVIAFRDELDGRGGAR